MLKRLLLAIVFFISLSGFCQYNATIRSGRPGQSIGPYAVGKKIIQIQTGIEFSNFSGIFNAKNYEGGLVVRYGITEKFEVNTGWKYTYQTNEVAFIEPKMGLNLGSVGCRINLIEGENYTPSIGLQSSLKFPRLSSDFSTQRLATKMLLIVRQKLSKKLNLMTNFGLDYSGNSTIPTGLFVCNLGYNINSKFGLNIEAFGSYNTSAGKIYFDAGARYLINSDFQLDLTIGGGMNHNTNNIFCNTGLSWRLGKQQR